MREKNQKEHIMPYIFVCFFFSSSSSAFVHNVQFHSRVTNQTRKKEQIQSTVNTEMRGKKEEEEGKIQLSKHTISYHIWIVQCPILDVHFFIYVVIAFFQAFILPLPIASSHSMLLFFSPPFMYVCSLSRVTCCLMDILQYWTWPNRTILISYINRTCLTEWKLTEKTKMTTKTTTTIEKPTDIKWFSSNSQIDCNMFWFFFCSFLESVSFWILYF